MRRVFFGVYGIKLVRRTPSPLTTRLREKSFFGKPVRKPPLSAFTWQEIKTCTAIRKETRGAAEQMNGKKKTLFVVFGVIILLAAVVGIYAVSRRVAFNNNEILLSFEQYNPEVYTSEYSGITYYEYECDNGRVICQYEPIVVTAVRDDKRGFVKEYKDNILRSVMDLRTDAIINFFRFRYKHSSQRLIRSDEEVAEIKQ